LESAADLTPVIVSAALSEDGRAEHAVETLNAFIAVLGAEAGNLGLKVAATGGVYLGGGIPPRILPFLENGLFLNGFSHKGQLSSFLETVPVHMILDPGTALLGAACYGLEQMQGSAVREVGHLRAGALPDRNAHEIG
jgi:glucokinase